MANIGSLLIGLAAGLFGGDAACGDPPRPCVTKMRVGGPVNTAVRPNYDAFDHAAFDCLLRQFVDCRGQVCYQTWKCDGAARIALQDYLVSLGSVRTDDDKASIQGQIAFYVNTYNALVIWGILHEYPTASIQAHNRKQAPYRIFDDLEVWIDGDYLSLNSIENDVLRKLGDFRIHFALVCAAKGCPKLRCEAYVQGRLEEQLVANALDFFSRSDRFQVCKLTGQVRLSPILKWFREDFGASDCEVLAAIMPYLPCGDHDWVCRHQCATIKYMGYNWALNDQCPTPGVRLGSTPYALYAKLEPVLRPFLPKKPTTPEFAVDEFALATKSTESARPRATAIEGSGPTDPPPPRALEIKGEGSTEPPPPRAIDVKGGLGYTPGRAIRLYGGLLPRMVAQPVAERPTAITAKPSTITPR